MLRHTARAFAVWPLVAVWVVVLMLEVALMVFIQWLDGFIGDDDGMA